MKRGKEGGVNLLSEDVLQNILSRLPALSYASAACVSRSWCRVAAAGLSRPKIASAISLNPSCEDAVKEVVDSVLSRPIRPHFAYAACFGEFSDLELTQKLITKKLGSATPVVTSFTRGTIDSDAIREEFMEVNRNFDFEDCDYLDDFDLTTIRDQGIVLIVGFVPGLKVDAIPLLRESEEPYILLIDKFVMDIRDYSAAVSGCTSPTGIVMFVGTGADMEHVLDEMDYAMSTETAILCGRIGYFMYRSGDDSRNISGSLKYYAEAVALVFARDNEKPQGVGETQFHVALSTGLEPVGPTHKAVSVKLVFNISECSTWLNASKEGINEVLDGHRILNDIYDEMDNGNASRRLFIGVTKQIKCSIGPEKVRWVTALEFYVVQGGNEKGLRIKGSGIKEGDPFRFYRSDYDSVLSSCNRAFEELRNLKQVCGGIVFSCYSRSDPTFSGRSGVDISPFLENFPGVPLSVMRCGRGGLISSGLIGRDNMRAAANRQEGLEECSPRCSCLRYCATLFLVVSYTL